MLAVLDALTALRIDYMLVGSFSSNLYGVARSTRDADFLVQFAGKSVSDLARRLGPEFRLDPQMPFETVTGTSRQILEVSGTPFRIELFLLSDDPYDQARFARRRQEKLLGRDAFVPSPEDVIVTKLRWSRQGRRTKDVDDVRNVIAVQAERLDWDYVHHWCDAHGTRQLLDQIRASIPPI